MMKKYKGQMVVTSIVILLPILIGLLLWNRLPEEIVIHWGANGQPDGWSHKGWAVFGMPGFLLLVHWLCTLISGLDPKMKEQNRKPLSLVLWVCPAVSVLIGVITYATALGINISVDVIMPLFLGVLFMFIGNYLPKCKQNYTLGIKIPWTLDNEENWNRTHRMAGKLWMAAGLTCMISALLPVTWKLIVFFVILLVAVIVPTIYSYLIYKKSIQDK